MKRTTLDVSYEVVITKASMGLLGVFLTENSKSTFQKLFNGKIVPGAPSVE